MVPQYEEDRQVELPSEILQERAHAVRFSDVSANQNGIGMGLASFRHQRLDDCAVD